MPTKKRNPEYVERFGIAAQTAKWAVTMTQVAIRRAIADNPWPHWHLLSFTGKRGRESRGVVDMIAIRKDHGEPNHPAVVINNSASATINADGESPNQRSFDQGFAMGAQRAAEQRAAKAAMGYSDVRISIIDAKSKQIVFAYSGEKNGSNQLTKTAQDCAKHLKEFIKKSEKKS